MGKLIDEEEIYKRLRPKLNNGDLDDIMLNLPTVEAIPKEQYEARLKADMMAMLEEIDLEFEELTMNTYEFDVSLGYRNIIEEKIDKLKRVEE